jgi:two-component system sensor histidine kinase RegB
MPKGSDVQKNLIGELEMPVAVPPLERASPEPQLSAARAHLAQEFAARNVVLGAVAAWYALILRELPAGWVAAVLAVAVAVNVVTWLRLRQPGPVTHGEFMAQILCDVALIALAVHYAEEKGSLPELSLIPLTIAAATLPWRHVLVVYVAVFVLHEVVCHFLPGAVWPDPDERRFELLAGGLIAYIVYSMARGSRVHEAQVAQWREKYLKQRHAAELGTVAASTAHDLGSPLATLAVLIGELRTAPQRASQKETLELMAREIDVCKRVSSRLLALTGNQRAEGGGKLAADRFVAGIVDKCRLMQPWMTVEHRVRGRTAPPSVLADAALEQAVLVLLHASPGAPRQIEISHEWDGTHLRMQVCDYGLISSVSADDGTGTPLFALRPPPESKLPDLLMAKAAIDRFGATLTECQREPGRVCIELAIPLSKRATQEPS